MSAEKSFAFCRNKDEDIDIHLNQTILSNNYKHLNTIPSRPTKIIRKSKTKSKSSDKIEFYSELGVTRVFGEVNMHFLCQKRSLENIAVVFERQRIAFIEATESNAIC
jgi:hypothetical protein